MDKEFGRQRSLLSQQGMGKKRLQHFDLGSQVAICYVFVNTYVSFLDKPLQYRFKGKKNSFMQKIK